MQVTSLPSNRLAIDRATEQVPTLPGALVNGAAGAKNDVEQKKLRKAFDDFVGQTFYGQMLSAMRKTVDKPAYFHGGQAEEVFQAQLDQTLAERLSDATADQFTGPMFDLFTMARR